MSDAFPDPTGFLGPEGQSDPFGPATKWTWIDIIAGRVDGDPDSAWRALIERYREPIRRSILRRTAGRCSQQRSEEIADLFFGEIIVQDVLQKACRERGRFRQFISGVIRIHVLTELRPPGRPTSPLEHSELELEAPANADSLENRELADWARALLTRAWTKLDSHNRRAARLLGKFYGISPHEPVASEQICREESMTPQALHTALSRARSLLARRIQDEVRETIEPDDFADEYETIKGEILALHPGLL